jgi:hypothetical protein
MADLWVLVTIPGFFALCAGLVWGCDKIIGPDDASDLATDLEDATSDFVEATR